MKTIAVALAIVALAASPAFAKTKQHQKAMQQNYVASGESDSSYALANGAYTASGWRTSGVYPYDAYQGWDPDPAIRLQLMRDPPGITQ